MLQGLVEETGIPQPAFPIEELLFSPEKTALSILPGENFTPLFLLEQNKREKKL